MSNNDSDIYSSKFDLLYEQDYMDKIHLNIFNELIFIQVLSKF